MLQAVKGAARLSSPPAAASIALRFAEARTNHDNFPSEFPAHLSTLKSFESRSVTPAALAVASRCCDRGGLLLPWESWVVTEAVSDP